MCGLGAVFVSVALLRLGVAPFGLLRGWRPTLSLSLSLSL